MAHGTTKQEHALEYVSRSAIGALSGMTIQDAGVVLLARTWERVS